MSNAFPSTDVTSAAGADDFAAPARDEALAWTGRTLVVGLFLTAVVGTPSQTVLPDTIKSVAAVLFALAALAVLLWETGTRRVPLRWSHGLWVPFALAAYSVASVLWSPTAQALTEAVRWLVIGLWAALAFNVATRARFASVARALHAAAVLMALLALLQFWLDIDWFPSVPPGATFGNRNMFAEFVVVCLPFSLWWTARQPTASRACIAAIGLGFSLVALMATGTRAALVAALLLLPIAAVGLLLARRRGAVLVPGRALALVWAIPVAMVGVLGMVPTNNATLAKENAYESRGWTPIERAVTRLGSLGANSTYEEGSSFGVRRAAWAAGRQMVDDHPLRGVGAGAWNTASPLYSPDTLDVEHVWMAHNEALQLVAEYGLIGWFALATFVGLLAVAAAEVWRLGRAGRGDAALALGAAALSAGMFAIVSLSGLALHTPATACILAVALGLVASLAGARSIRRVGPLAPAPARWATAAVGLVWLAAAAVSVQGLRADAYLQTAQGIFATLIENPGLPKDMSTRMREEAVEKIRLGYAIYENQGLMTTSLADSLGALGDPQTMLWLTDVMLKTRPHVVALKCNQIKAQADMGHFELSAQLLAVQKQAHPNAPCVELSELVYQYRSNRFAEATAIGERLIVKFDKRTEPAIARYIVDTSYRSAIRVPAMDRAVRILEVRAARFSEVRAASWMLIGQIRAGSAPGQVLPDALEAFKTALAAATQSERAAMLGKVPEGYRAQLPRG